MKIMWLSNAPWAATGYGVQTRLFAPRIIGLGYELVCMSNYGLQGGVISMDEKLDVLPLGYDRHGNDIILPHFVHTKSDLLISLYDQWVFDENVMTRLRWCPWTPVDHDPIPPPVAEKLGVAYQPIAYSHFGFEQMEAVGLTPKYVPHGVDTKVFCPGDRMEAREMMQLPADKDTFVAAMVAANKGFPCRKAFPEVFLAWAEFQKEYDNVMLYLHTEFGPQRGGADLLALLKQCGVNTEKVRFCDPYRYVISYPFEYMAAVYRAADVLINPSYGEGFGVPIVEAQACGCPVIVGDWTSMPELCFSGWKCRGQKTYTGMASWQYVPSVRSIYGHLVRAYKARNNDRMKDLAVAGAAEYDADLVTEKYWRPVLAQLEGEVMATKVQQGGFVQLGDK